MTNSYSVRPCPSTAELQTNSRVSQEKNKCAILFDCAHGFSVLLQDNSGNWSEVRELGTEPSDFKPP